MYTIKPEMFKEKRKKMRHSYRSLSDETKRIDKRGKGVSKTTCVRVETVPEELNTRSLLLICEALEISPRTIFRKEE